MDEVYVNCFLHLVSPRCSPPGKRTNDGRTEANGRTNSRLNGRTNQKGAWGLSKLRQIIKSDGSMNIRFCLPSQLPRLAIHVERLRQPTHKAAISSSSSMITCGQYLQLGRNGQLTRPSPSCSTPIQCHAMPCQSNYPRSRSQLTLTAHMRQRSYAGLSQAATCVPNSNLQQWIHRQMTLTPSGQGGEKAEA